MSRSPLPDFATRRGLATGCTVLATGLLLPTFVVVGGAVPAVLARNVFVTDTGLKDAGFLFELDGKSLFSSLD